MAQVEATADAVIEAGLAASNVHDDLQMGIGSEGMYQGGAGDDDYYRHVEAELRNSYPIVGQIPLIPDQRSIAEHDDGQCGASSSGESATATAIARSMKIEGASFENLRG